MVQKKSKTVAPYGSWASPISSDLIVTGSIRLNSIVLDGEDIYWTEGRPSENGRSTIIKWSPETQTQEEMSPAGFNIRSRAHEYGGGEFTVHDEIIYFSNFVDQRLYVQYPYSEADPLTAPENLRFADGQVDPTRGRLYCIREQHQTGEEPTNTLVSIDLDGYNETGDVIHQGYDFYATPRISPSGDQIAWICWNHPNMPWDSTELWVADLDEFGNAVNPQRVAGGENESIFQPSWSPAGVLHFVSDKTNWWNLYRLNDDEIEPLYPMDAEFGFPQWVFGMSTYGFESANSIICAYTQNGMWNIGRLNSDTKTLKPFDLPFTTISDVQVSEDTAAFLGGSASLPKSVVRLDLNNGQFNVLRQSASLSVGRPFISIPEPIEFPTEDGMTSYGIYYPPTNPDFTAPEGTAPPLLVLSHGGPTGASSTMLNLSIQYWTSRGFAVVDVNYSGSTGYGRSYRLRLNDKWGVLDVQDCINAAKYLVDKGLADSDKLAIRGGSAGGYTTLCALTFYDTFTAGASHYGISDIEALARDTHKFESRYLDRLIAPYPEGRDLYVERSPIHHVDKINCPIILFQGLDDKVVPPNQAEMLFDAVKAKGLPVAYVPFEGEGHGFRQAPNMKRALDGELYFYSKVFNFDLADKVEPVDIENL